MARSAPRNATPRVRLRITVATAVLLPLLAACAGADQSSEAQVPRDQPEPLSSTEINDTEDQEVTQPPPPVQIVNQPIPDELTIDLEDTTVELIDGFCFLLDESGNHLEELPADSEECFPNAGTGVDEDSRPAQRPAARILAELKLPGADGSRALFVIFRSRGRGPCFTGAVVASSENQKIGLTCSGDRTCISICIELLPVGEVEGDASYVMIGTVSAQADLVRLVFGPDQVELYPAAGPLIDELPGQRIFMLDLGAQPKPLQPPLVELVSDY